MGVHGLWELACRPPNHSEIPMRIVEELVAAMGKATREPIFNKQRQRGTNTAVHPA